MFTAAEGIESKHNVDRVYCSGFTSPTSVISSTRGGQFMPHVNMIGGLNPGMGGPTTSLGTANVCGSWLMEACSISADLKV